MAKNVYLRCDIYNILVNAAKFSAEQDAGGFGTVIAADLAARLLEKIARRAWEIGDEEIKCHCYRLGLIEKTDTLEDWFENVLNKMMESKAKGEQK
jgi:hypothetical protein